jgi:hypothetical protein
VTLRDGEVVRHFDPSLVTVVQTSPSYKYRFVLALKVKVQVTLSPTLQAQHRTGTLAA